MKEWTLAELRAKQQKKDTRAIADKAPDGEPVSAAVSGVSTAGDPSTSKTDAPLTDATLEPDGTMVAGAIHATAKRLHVGIELLTTERLSTLKIMEERDAAIKPLVALLKVLLDQLHNVK